MERQTKQLLGIMYNVTYMYIDVVVIDACDNIRDRQSKIRRNQILFIEVTVHMASL